MVPPPTGHRRDGRRLGWCAGDGGRGGFGRPLSYGKIRHEATSKAVKPISNAVDTATTVT